MTTTDDIDIDFDPGIALTGELLELSVDDLHPADDNPRSDLGDLDGLAASIAAVGILEPLIVVERVIAGGYTIVAGHRRHAAARLAGLTTVPCVVREMTTEQRMEAMLVENLQREGLTPLDEARAMQWLVDLGHTQRQIAERVGCNQSHVSRRLALTKLPEAATKLVVDGKLHLRQAEELAALPDEDIDDVVAIVTERSEHRVDQPVADWEIPRAIDKLKKKRKLATAIAAGEASGLKKLTSYSDRPGQYGSKYEKCKKPEATHYYVDDYSGAITWGRKKPKPSTSTDAGGADDATGISLRDEWRQARERAQAEEKANGELLVRLLDFDPDLVRDAGLAIVVDELGDSGPYQESALRSSDLRQLIGDDRYAALTDDHALTIAACALAGYTDPETAASEEFEATLRETWARLRDAAEAHQLIDGWTVTPVDPDPNANDQFALVDGAPVDENAPTTDDVVHSDEEPQATDPEQVDEPAPAGVDLVQALADAVDAARAGDIPKSWTTTPPWAAWPKSSVAQLLKRIPTLTSAAKVRRCCVYEQATTGRAEIVDACLERLHVLEKQ